MRKELILCILVTMSVVQAKHIHPRRLVNVEDIEVETDNSDKAAELDEIPVNVIHNVRPSRFVPINSVFFFKTYPPCEDGLERDLLGICREVWD